ncbi:YoaK family protein [Sulfitobacter sp. F26169L]|uniref:YoaK family protein n=1 Tax=Sulfitobacter sp. F26169L TaxID=2996015 RepID=UPI002260A638|nr:YoaK family protein [Sulfitobacter sp. F26169L]MCX7564981.1 YoaK family protein [Sulfitobacter sp. F26169L]
MITKLPGWIELAALLLAFIAGFMNVVGLLGFDRLAISHVSGNASMLGATMADASFPAVGQLIGILIAFVLGAAISGGLLRRGALVADSRYTIALIIEAALIFVAYGLLKNGIAQGYFAVAAACGAQNALATTYSGGIVRTTHLTGIFTDLGLMLGTRIRGGNVDGRKAALFLLITAGFLSGGMLGALLYPKFAFAALFLPMIVCLAMALAFWIGLKRSARD